MPVRRVRLGSVGLQQLPLEAPGSKHTCNQSPHNNRSPARDSKPHTHTIHTVHTRPRKPLHVCVFTNRIPAARESWALNKHSTAADARAQVSRAGTGPAPTDYGRLSNTWPASILLRFLGSSRCCLLGEATSSRHELIAALSRPTRTFYVVIRNFKASAIRGGTGPRLVLGDLKAIERPLPGTGRWKNVWGTRLWPCSFN